MATFAIKGHETRGKEVIEIFEMLGGKNQNNVYSGKDTFHYYFIDNETGYIRTKLYTDDCWTKLTYNIFTLEEFLEKFPYKVGDRVTNYNDIELEVVRMYWDNIYDAVRYDVREVANKSHFLYSLLTAHLQPYQEETMKEDMENGIVYDEIDFNRCPAADKVHLILGTNYEIREESGEYYVVKKLPKYPKTYEECCKVIGISRHDVEIDLPQPYQQNIFNLFNLLICRDAYWKIAGEQMGLGKPWEPDYKNPDIDLYVIINIYNQVEKAKYGRGFQQCVLTFPTAEMQDIFYENFKKEIEECKELL